MDAHPTDSIPAFVLGALDPDEALQVGMHLSTCPTCRAEADAFLVLLESLPYAVPQRHPPAHVKQQIFARIDASNPKPRPGAPSSRSRWLMGISGGALALALAFGYMMADARTQLAQTQQLLDTARRQQAASDRMASFIMAPQTIARQLAGRDQRANAMMYMQPDSRRAVLIVHDLPRLASGKVYRCWLAKLGVQVPFKGFDVDQYGAAALMIEAPAPINQYDQVMVTVEQAGDSSQPSSDVVLSGSLASAPRAIARAARMVMR